MTHFIEQYGLIVVFLLIAAESSGIPLPGETALVAAGVFASKGHYSIVTVIVVAATAAIVGDNIGYWLGRELGRGFLQRYAYIRRFSERVLPRAERFFEKHGGKAIFLARFSAGVRVAGAWIAGFARMPWWRFFAWNAAGGIVWASTVGLVSFYFGQAAADAIARYGLIGGVPRRGVIVVVLPVCTSGGNGWRNGSEDACCSSPLVGPWRWRRRCRFNADALDHVVVIVFENKDPSMVDARSAPTFASLGRRYARITHYTGVSHPSLPNYLALVSGSTHGITNDCTTCRVTGSTIGDQLTRAKRTWFAYAEGYPSSPRFAKKHMPFLYFPHGADHVVPLTRFKATALPQFSFVVPDLCNDMHDCPVATGDAWLKRFVPPLLTLPHTVVFVIFDEGTSTEGGGGAVVALALGTAVRRGAVFSKPTNHYGLLRTIEDAWGLPRLGRAAPSTPIQGIWR